MTTKLGAISSRAVARETRAIVQGRPIIAKLEAGGRMVRFKQKGLRTWHSATVEQLFWVAVGNTVQECKRQKAEARKARNAARRAHR